MKEKLAVLFMTTAVLPACAADWALATDVSNREMVHFYDLSSFRRSGNTVIFWVNMFKADAKSDTLNAMTRYRVDCLEQTAVMLAYVVYKKNGENKSVTPDVEQRDPLIPGSVLERRAMVACEEGFPVQAIAEKRLRRLELLTPETAARQWLAARARE